LAAPETKIQAQRDPRRIARRLFVSQEIDVMPAVAETQGETPNDPIPQEGAGASTNANVQTATGSSQTPDDVSSLPPWAQKLFRDLNRENASRRKAQQEADATAKAAEETARVAEEAKLVAQQQWQTLAEQRKAELDALKVKAERYDALSAETTAALDVEIATWPDEVKGLRPTNADAAQLTAWVRGARPLVAKLTQAATVHPAGQAPPPKPAGNGVVASAQRQAEAIKLVKSKF
jgi:hypothetical protein